MLFENGPEYVDWKYIVDRTCRERAMRLRHDFYFVLSERWVQVALQTKTQAG